MTDETHCDRGRHQGRVAMVEYLVVAVVAFVGGGVATPPGFVLGLPVIGTYLAPYVGALLGHMVFALAGALLRRRIEERTAASASADTRVGRIVDRFGARGLGLIGSRRSPG